MVPSKGPCKGRAASIGPPLPGRQDFEVTDLNEGIGVFRFIQRQRHRAGHFSRHEHPCPRRDCRRVQKLSLQGHESALGLSPVKTQVPGAIEREL